MNPIFISYRREDTAGEVGRLYDSLKTKLAPNSVFQDVENIRSGEDYRTRIKDCLSSCDAFLPVIGRNWLTARDSSGQCRLNNSDDPVRQEIAFALERNIPVIPVLVQAASMPTPDQLPDDLRKLADRNAFELSGPRWHRDLELLIDRLIAIGYKRSIVEAFLKLARNKPITVLVLTFAVVLTLVCGLIHNPSLWTLIVGLVVGSLAKLLLPGKNPGGFIVNVVLGVVGSSVATCLCRVVGWCKKGASAGFFLSVIGAILLLLIYRSVVSMKSSH
jgi:uncharacterized membrane protein YeaQ/YmgE (transglycosylase-associated protein family)